MTLSYGARPAGAEEPGRVSDAELAIAGLLAGALPAGAPDADEDFTRLGGDAAGADRAAALIAAEFGVTLTGDLLRELGTPRRIAAYVEEAALADLDRLFAADDMDEAEADTGDPAGCPDVHNGAADRVPAVSRDADLPLSFAQQRLWFLDQLHPGGTEYLVTFGVHLTGDLDVAALRAALTDLAARHEPLRTVFPMPGADAPADTTVSRETAPNTDPVQRILPPSSFPLDYVTDGTVDDLLDTAVFQPMNLATGPLARGWLLRTGEQEHVLLLALHHIVCDGWSFGVLARDLDALYRARCAGTPASLTPLPVQYADYAAWQRDRLAGPAGEEQLAYWTRRLAGIEVLETPTDKPRPAVRSGAGGSVPFHLPPETMAGLRGLAAGAGASAYMAGLAVFQLLLSRYTGRDDVAVGTPIAGRTHADTEDLVGFFVNTLVMRTDLSGDPTVAELLARVRDDALDAYANQELPFERIVERLAPERDLSRNPLVSTMFAFQNVANTGDWPLGGLDTRVLDIERRSARFDVSAYLTERADGGVDGRLVYAADLFEPATIERMAGHFTVLAAAMAAAGPDTRVADLDLLSPNERRALSTDANATAMDVPRDTTVHALVEAVAAASPEAPAVVYGDTALTFADLNARADRLARHLRELGARPGAFVALCLDRGPDLVPAVLAVLKSGAAYLPMDPGWPADRMAFMLDDTSAPIVVTTSGLAGRLPETDAHIVALDRDADAIASRPDGPPEPLAGPRDLAYVIYTSGSTGRPKAVMLEHASVVNFLTWASGAFPAAPGLGSMLHSSIAFDFEVPSLFLPLLQGQAVAVLPPMEPWDARRVARMFAEGAAFSTLKLTPSHLEILAEAMEATGDRLNVRTLVVAGEPFEARLAHRVRPLLGPDTVVINEYGPTETTVGAVTYVVDYATLPATGAVPIGFPVGNTELYVVDAADRLVPAGVPGELLIGGAGLARGYLNRPELTAEKFVPHPFSDDPGARVYRTGDLVKRLPGGEIEFLGRIDDQVKMRGLRIELGEIETAILAGEDVAACTVVVREGVPGDKRLTAYLVAGAGLDLAALRAALGERLPGYMVPTSFVLLDALPLTANGKVNRKALPAPDTDRSTLTAEYAPPATPTERAIAGIWADVLGVADLGVHDDFFDLGGHSLLATRVIAHLRRALSVELGVGALFTHPTIRRLAELVDEGEAGTATPIPRAARDGDLPLSFAQQRLWFLDRLDPGAGEYVVPVAVRVRGPLDLPALESAVSGLVARHEVLRTRYAVGGDGNPVQVIDPPGDVTATVVDVAGEDEAAAELAARSARGFDLAADRLLRLTVLRRSPTDHHVLVVMHHIVSDGWTSQILARELEELYAAAVEHRDPALPALPVQYADYAVWQREHLAGPAAGQQLAYWSQRLAGLEALELPLDRPRPTERTGDGDGVTFTLDPATAAGLKAMAGAHGASLFMTGMALFTLLLSRYTGQTDIAVGTPIAGRTHADVEHLVGFFVNTLVLRTDLSGDPTVAEVMAAVRADALAAYANQDLPFERLVDHLAPGRDLARNPLFEAMFSLQNGDGTTWRLPGCEVAPVHVDNGRAKFDLSLTLVDGADGITGHLDYATDIFDRATIERMAGHLRHLAAGFAAAAPDTPVGDLDLMTAEERHRILVDWNDTAVDYPADATIHSLIERTAEAVPDRTAVICGDASLTYAELDTRANRLAHHLRDLGAGPGRFVAVCLDRSPELIVALLAILKSGSAYVPVDPAYPPARIAFLLDDTAAPVVVTNTALAATVPAADAAAVVVLDRDAGAIAARPGHAPEPLAGPDDIAYIIYTSGSTGKPKGVLLRHRGVVSLLHGTHNGLTGEDVVLMFASVMFDVSVEHTFATLAAGARLILREDDWTPRGLVELIRRHRVTLTEFPPTVFEAVLDHIDPAEGGLGERFRFLIVGGEAVSAAAINRWFERTTVPMANSYGPTEITVTATAANLTGPVDGRVPMGRPIANVQIYVVDSAFRPVPVGVAGELLISGTGLAAGYLNRPELTAEKFVPHPFSDEPGARVYRTGDLVRRLPDGQIEFLGRLDDQVKVRGLRIELGEIEAAIVDTGTVDACTVIVREDQPGDKRLVAYVATTRPYDPAETRAALKARLPEYMVPAAFVVLDVLPVLPSGKTNRAALPAPDPVHITAEDYVAPRDEIEEALAGLWSELLGVDRVGVHDGFFDLGGHSLLATQMVNRLETLTGVRVGLRRVFLAPTIAELRDELVRLVDEMASDTRQP